MINSKRFCNDGVSLENTIMKKKTINQRMIEGNGPHPLTMVPPPIIAPSHDIIHWRTSDCVTNSAINSSRCVYQRSELSDPVIVEPSGIPPPRVITTDWSTNVFTQLIQPNIFTRNEIIEPISTNYGISATIPMGNSVAYKNGNETMIIEKYPQSPVWREPIITIPGSNNYFLKKRDIIHQPQGIIYQPQGIIHQPQGIIYQPQGIIPQGNHPQGVDVAAGGSPNSNNVYDPRSGGYGDSNRGMIEPVTGQPRWNYTDIDSVLRPNFISRNKIDMLPNAPTYGRMKPVLEGQAARQQAHDAFLNSQLQFRTELQHSLGSAGRNKRQAEKLFPKHTNY